ncbi:MAG: cytochrome ubiquinol oxidase subunit I [Prevotellaceae bacterium]|nr:cytochrome ubiquinol oxidase subunit I [Prevotellaceae bacterium]
MTDLLISTGLLAVNWARAQFALTAAYHWLFVPLTLGLALIMGIMETCYFRTGKAFWRETARFWQRLFGINFAMGVATGLILEFEFGTNWSNYSWLVGDVFGAPLAVEGIVAFFLEATFVGVMFFGWGKVSKRFHLASTWLTGIGATVSAWWILVANAWMQSPVGQHFNPDTMRNEMTSFREVALSPFAIDKFVHTVLSAWIVGALFVSAVSCYYLFRKAKGEGQEGERRMAVQSFKIAAIVGLVSACLTALSGDESGYRVAKSQPMKLAAMEALYDGGNGVSLTAVALVNPFKQPDYASGEEPPMRIAIPNMLSVLATRSLDGYVPGVNDLIRGGYELPDGTLAPSLDEKMDRGRQAIAALAAYRQAQKDGDEAAVAESGKALDENIQYFGYGYVDNAEQIVPFIPVCFWTFRLMVGLGMLFCLFFLVALVVAYKWDFTTRRFRWLHVVGMVMLPLGYVASEAGWLLAEFGRQPWTIQDMLPTWVAVSDVSAGAVMLTFFIFLVLFTLLLVVELSIMCKAVRRGPNVSQLIKG